MDARTPSFVARGELSCHCLLLETESELILVDTGLGRRDVQDPKGRLSGFFLRLVSPDFRDEMTAFRQVQSLGYDARDVRHIVLTHLDFDHAGGLDDFPQATVHLMTIERDYAFQQRTWLDRQRFRPQQWSTRANWQTYQADPAENWFGFDRVHALEGVPPEIVLIPLIGHTFGHAGVAVEVSAGIWLLYAGDGYFFREEMNTENPSCTPGLRFYQTFMEKDRKARLQNQERLRELRRQHDDHITVFCAHDVVEFERLSGRSAKLPANAVTTARDPYGFRRVG